MKDDHVRRTMCPDHQNRVCRTRQVPVFDAQELLGESCEVRLRHCRQEYRLMLTRNNKLILTK